MPRWGQSDKLTTTFIHDRIKCTSFLVQGTQHQSCIDTNAPLTVLPFHHQNHTPPIHYHHQQFALADLLRVPATMGCTSGLELPSRDTGRTSVINCTKTDTMQICLGTAQVRMQKLIQCKSSPICESKNSSTSVMISHDQDTIGPPTLLRYIVYIAQKLSGYTEENDRMG